MTFRLKVSHCKFYTALVVVSLSVFAIILSTLMAVIEFHHDLPFMDGWSGVIDFMNLSYGYMGQFQLFGLHNEHRIPLIRILNLVDNAALNGRGWLPVFASWAVTFVLAGLFAYFMRRTLRLIPGIMAFGLVVSLLFCGIQLTNLSEPFQFSFISVGFFAVAALCAFARAADRGDLASVIIWIVFYVAAACSLASGLLVGPICLLVGLALRCRRRLLVGAAMVSVLLGWLYVNGYHTPPGHPSPLLALQHPGRLTLFVPAELGSVFKYVGLWPAVWLGTAGLGLTCVQIRRAWRTCPAPGDAALLGTIVFTIVSATLTAAGRSGWGLPQSQEDRYTTVSCLFWAAQVAYWGRSMGRGRVRLSGRIALLAVFLLALAGVAYNHVRGLGSLYDIKLSADSSGDAYMVGVLDQSTLGSDFPDVPSAVQWANFLKLARLSVFSTQAYRLLHAATADYFVTLESGNCLGHVDRVVKVDNASGYRLAGWAWNILAHRAPARLFIERDGKIEGLGTGGFARPDAWAAMLYKPWGHEPGPGWLGFVKAPSGSTVRVLLQIAPRSVCSIGIVVLHRDWKP